MLDKWLNVLTSYTTKCNDDIGFLRNIRAYKKRGNEIKFERRRIVKSIEVRDIFIFSCSILLQRRNRGGFLLSHSFTPLERRTEPTYLPFYIFLLVVHCMYSKYIVLCGQSTYCYAMEYIVCRVCTFCNMRIEYILLCDRVHCMYSTYIYYGYSVCLIEYTAVYTICTL